MNYYLELGYQQIPVKFNEEFQKQIKSFSYSLSQVIELLLKHWEKIKGLENGEEFLIMDEIVFSGTKYDTYLSIERLITNVL